MSEEHDEQGLTWSEIDKYTMPIIPAALTIDPMLAALVHLAGFVELSGEGTVDPDWAIEALEGVGYYLQRLPADRCEVLQAQLDHLGEHAVREGWEPDAVEFIRRFLKTAGVGGGEG